MCVVNWAQESFQLNPPNRNDGIGGSIGGVLEWEQCSQTGMAVSLRKVPKSGLGKLLHFEMKFTKDKALCSKRGFCSQQITTW